MQAKIVNQSSDFPVRRTGSYGRTITKKALLTCNVQVYASLKTNSITDLLHYYA